MVKSRSADRENPIRYIGCCGAYCKTCRSYVLGSCKGCKIGLDTGERDIRRAKCRIKICCFRDNKLDTCADCSKFESCDLIGNWYAKKGYHGEKYKKSLEYIKKNTYSEFIKLADRWKGASGKLES